MIVVWNGGFGGSTGCLGEDDVRSYGRHRDWKHLAESKNVQRTPVVPIEYFTCSCVLLTGKGTHPTPGNLPLKRFSMVAESLISFRDIFTEGGLEVYVFRYIPATNLEYPCPHHQASFLFHSSSEHLLLCRAPRRRSSSRSL